MLKTARAYREALDAIRVLTEEQIPSEEAKWRTKGASERTVQQIIGTMHARVGRLKEEVALYERIKAGDLSMFDSIADIGQLLIAARVQRGLSQRDLAERLGVHESQISRDERHEYQGLTVERLSALADALSLSRQVMDTLMYAVEGNGKDFEIHSEAAAVMHPSAASRATKASRQSASSPELSPSLSSPNAKMRPSGFAPTRIPSAPLAARYANRGWQSAPSLSSMELSAGLPRIPVVVSLEGLVATAGGTAGATGPEGPFVYVSSFYANAA